MVWIEDPQPIFHKNPHPHFLYQHMIVITRLKMTTYKEIQGYVKNRYGFEPKTCWIAHVKEIHGLNLRKRSKERSNPCPHDKIECIEDALRHFKMI